MIKIKNTLADSMISEDFDIYCIEDFVNETLTQYHTHDFYEIHITLSGQGTFFLDGSYQTIDAGTILLIHPSDLHRICAQNTNYFERVFIYITPKYLQRRSSNISNLEKCFEPVGNSKSKILKIEIKEIYDYLRLFAEQKETKTYGDDLIFEQNLINFLIYINKKVLNDDFKILENKVNGSTLIDNVINYINSHLSEDLSLETVAKEFFISKYHLSHKFKDVTDMTYNTYLFKKRLAYSKRLLRRKKNASEVFQECGFSSYSYFLKSFKKEFGITPKEFLKRTKDTKNLYFKDDSYR
ncbi:MAG: AraC family transcriptional regulator [Lachnospirales bacterium]